MVLSEVAPLFRVQFRFSLAVFRAAPKLIEHLEQATFEIRTTKRKAFKQTIQLLIIIVCVGASANWLLRASRIAVTILSDY